MTFCPSKPQKGQSAALAFDPFLGLDFNRLSLFDHLKSPANRTGLLLFFCVDLLPVFLFDRSHQFAERFAVSLSVCQRG